MMEVILYSAITGFFCFVLGYITAMLVIRNQTDKETKTDFSRNKSIDSSAYNKQREPNQEIRAIQTVGRRGASLDTRVHEGIFKGVKSKKKHGLPELNFSGIGVASESERDDLKKINGIGPFIEQKLNNVGIYTYHQISRFTDYEIETVTELIEFFPGRIKRDRWQQQAADLIKKSKSGN